MIKINLLPKELAVHRETNLWTVAAYAVPVVVVATLGLMSLLRQNELNALNQEVETLNAELAARQEAVQEKNRLEQRRAELNVFVSVKGQLQSLSSNWREDLNRFVGQIPTGSTNPTISLSKLGVTAAAPNTTTFDGRPASKVLVVMGTAKTNQDMIDFVKAFENSKDFAIQFQTAQRQDKSSRYDFTVNVNLVKASTEQAPAETPATPTTPAAGGTPQ